MNIKKYILATIAAFIFIFILEWLWHGMLMKSMYETTKSVWRPEDPAYMGYIFASQLLFALVLTFIYTKIGKHINYNRGLAFGFFAGLLLAMPQLGSYSYLPIPLSISLMWMLASLLKGMGAGLIIASIYKK